MLRLPSDVSVITSQDLYQHYGKDLCGRVDSVFGLDSDSNLSDRLRANVLRFSAYKAEYVSAALNRALNSKNISEKEREQLAKAVIRTFNRYQDAERTTATARARTAKQFEEFMQSDNLKLFPNLKWLASRSADPRLSHTAFYNRIWAKDDPFWLVNAPGTEWNCKCDIEQTDEPVTDNGQLPTANIPLGLEGNPAHTGEIFTDNASYIRAFNKSNTQQKKAESKCQAICRNQLQKEAATSAMLKQSGECLIEGKKQTVLLDKWGIRETAQSMFTTKEYWLKNEILANYAKYLPNSEYIGNVAVDLTHNTGNTLRLKRKFNRFHYVRITLSKGESLCLHIAEHRNGNYYLYTITKRSPI